MKMKKEYMAPEMYSVELKDESAVITGSNNIGTGGGDVPDEDPNAARGSRGEWGNIWKG